MLQTSACRCTTHSNAVLRPNVSLTGKPTRIRDIVFSIRGFGAYRQNVSDVSRNRKHKECERESFAFGLKIFDYAAAKGSESKFATAVDEAERESTSGTKQERDAQICGIRDPTVLISRYQFLIGKIRVGEVRMDVKTAGHLRYRIALVHPITWLFHSMTSFAFSGPSS